MQFVMQRFDTGAGHEEEIQAALGHLLRQGLG